MPLLSGSERLHEVRGEKSERERERERGREGETWQVVYQPGNAYNEESIAVAKRLGKEIFREMEREERKERINQQVSQCLIT